MKKLNPKIASFLKNEHVSVLTTILTDGTPHSAAMHFAMNTDTNEFVFFTKHLSDKCKHLNIGRKYLSSFVVGFDEKRMVEFQSRGLVEKIDKSKSKTEEVVFAKKFKGAKLDRDHVVLKYTPTWWRYTEYKPKFTVISSEE